MTFNDILFSLREKVSHIHEPSFTRQRSHVFRLVHQAVKEAEAANIVVTRKMYGELISVAYDELKKNEEQLATAGFAGMEEEKKR